MLNRVSSAGNGPCHLNLDPSGRVLIAVNYGSGSVAAMAVRADGTLSDPATVIQHKGSSADPRRQTGPHAHSVNFSQDGRFAVVADLGLDQVLVYKVNAAEAKLSPNEPAYAKTAPGAGPRHFTFHPRGRWAYVINELASTITAFIWDSRLGTLTEFQTISTLPPGYSGSSFTAEIVAHPNGKYVYGSNRGHDSISVFSVDPKSGRLEFVEATATGGRTPRNFALEPGGNRLYAANQNSGFVAVFDVDPKTGRLKATNEKFEVDSPVCVRFLS
jgi:6-phosphogluconolactonase